MLATIGIWKQFGYYMLLWVAGLLAIPSELYEAARIDGASGLRLFRHITVPMLRPTTTFIIMVSTINAFQMFGPTYMMTGGGPIYRTTTLVYHLWVQAFEFYRMGRSGAIAMVLFVIILAMTLIQRRLLGWEENIY
jgi:ABC-type sugar transport system permease subunit